MRRAALPLMIKKWDVSSLSMAHGLLRAARRRPCRAKHGLVGLTKVTAIEVANQGITCTLFVPAVLTRPFSNRSRFAPCRASPSSKRADRCARSSRCSIHDAGEDRRSRSSCAAMRLTITGAALSIDVAGRQ